jgi:hypothetical protein
MNHNPITPRIYFTLAITAFAILHLSIEIFSGGVRVHYPLQREDMPALSNWWGLVLLPALAWLSHTFMDKDYSAAGVSGLSKVVVYRLAGAFMYGAVMGASFEFGLGQTPLYLLFGLLLGGIFYPLYRFEIILGIVMGMTYTFGAIIPTVVMSMVALISLVSYNSVRFVISKLKQIRE